MKRLSLFFWLLTAGIATALVFQVSNDVQGLEKELKQVKQDILREQESLHVLKAEWSYLTRPARIEDLARRHLGFEPLARDRISLVEYLPPRPEDFGRHAESERLTVPPRRPRTPASWTVDPAPKQAKPAAATRQAKTEPAKPTRRPEGPINPVTGRPLPVSPTLVFSGVQ